MMLFKNTGTMLSVSYVVLFAYMAGSRVQASEAPYYQIVPTQPSMDWALQVVSRPAEMAIGMKALEHTMVEQEQGVSLEFAGPSAWTESGQPRLPVFPILVELRPDVSYTVSIDPGEPVEFAMGHLLPVVTRQSISYSDTEQRVEESWISDPSIYEQDMFWPEHLHKTTEARGMGNRYLRIAVSAYQYNPVFQVLRYYPDLQVRIQFHSAEGDHN